MILEFDINGNKITHEVTPVDLENMFGDLEVKFDYDGFLLELSECPSINTAPECQHVMYHLVYSWVKKDLEDKFNSIPKRDFSVSNR